MTINIATEYSKTPGGRFKKEGPCSGEDFREVILLPQFEHCLELGEVLTVDLDGGYGYAISFLEEAFGGLARTTKNKAVLNIEIISNDEPALIEKIINCMKAELG